MMRDFEMFALLNSFILLVRECVLVMVVVLPRRPAARQCGLMGEGGLC